MESVKVSHKDFIEIAKENDYFIWHFLLKNQNNTGLTIRSIEDGGNKNSKHQLNLLLKEISIPYFESYTEDSIDFLHELGIPYNKIWNPKFQFDRVTPGERFFPLVIGFKKYEKVATTLELCYCVDGVTKIIGKLNPELILNHTC